ncbi:lipopolysaccharide transport periplasmic protein LptA [Serratia marcescens]|uniref:lipopolysaccharide transport periplasmic protein LptA n=1 Tax=Serratia marcescens TaxID=615 RepID=UPI003EE162F4
MKYLPSLLVTSLFYLPSAHATLSNNYTISSSSQRIDQDGSITSLDNVHIVSGTMTIRARIATFHPGKDGDSYITAEGNPITYAGTLDNGQPFTGSSNKLKYFIKSKDIILSENAFIKQGNNTVNAPRISYNIETRKIIATSNRQHRVVTVIHPDELSK